MFEGADPDPFAANLAYRYHLTLPQGRKLAALTLNELDPSCAPESPGHLADAQVTDVFIRRMLPPYSQNADALDVLSAFAEDAIEKGYETAGAWFVLATVAEYRGDLVSQKRLLERALTVDAAFEPALLALGFIAFVQGDVLRATRLLRELPDGRATDMLHTLSHYPPQRREGRNDPCPCGSGAKRKYCCGVDAPHPLADRAFWLWDKLEGWLRRLPQGVDLVPLATELSGAGESADDDARVVDALETPVTWSVALLERGLLGRFLDHYGSLLPVDERELAERWRDARHTVWRVKGTKPGWWLLLEDLVSGMSCRAMNGLVSRCTQPRELVYAAVVPTGAGWLLPCHPEGLCEDDAEMIAELLEAQIDPIAIAATVVRMGQSATM